LTEFGAIGDDDKIEEEQVESIAEWAHQHFQSYTYWQYKKFGDITTANALEPFWTEQGILEADKIALISRTFAYAIAGLPRETSFNSSTGHFHLLYETAKMNFPTEIIYNREMHYKGGINLKLSDGCVNADTSVTNYIYLLGTGCAIGTNITVTVTRK